MKHTLEIDGLLYESTALLSERYGIVATTLYRWHQKGFLPQPIKLGRRNYYVRPEVERHMRLGQKQAAGSGTTHTALPLAAAASDE